MQDTTEMLKGVLEGCVSGIISRGSTYGYEMTQQLRKLDVTGHDVAAFCDDLIKERKTYADDYQELLTQKVSKAIHKIIDKEK